MTLRTITFDDEQWQVVPKKMTPVMWHAAIAAHDAIGAWAAALANAPEPPAQQPMTAEQIASACVTYRHDFGLLPEVERHLLMAEARRWADAFGMEVER